MIGERIRVARARARMTLRDVAANCGCSAQAVKKWEDNTSMPSSSKLLEMCRIFDCSIEWIMSTEPLDFHSTDRAPEGRHAKYWVREALAQLREEGISE